MDCNWCCNHYVNLLYSHVVGGITNEINFSSYCVVQSITLWKTERKYLKDSQIWESICTFAAKYSWTMQIIFDDKDLEELITTGHNSKYKKYIRNAKFMKALAIAYYYFDCLNVLLISVQSLSSTTNSFQELMAWVPSELLMEWWSVYFSASLRAELEL